MTVVQQDSLECEYMYMLLNFLEICMGMSFASSIIGLKAYGTLFSKDCTETVLFDIGMQRPHSGNQCTSVLTDRSGMVNW